MAETGVARTRAGRPLALRVLLVIGFAIAVAATALVVFADDIRMLRLSAVLALWAALIAAFAVTRSRRDARAAAMRENEAQLAYQLELHREVAARREYEADLSRQVASAQADQLGELREQLERLTGALASLADGELTVSRLTLSAESARFRPGMTQAPMVTVGHQEHQDPVAELGWVDAQSAPAPGEGDGSGDSGGSGGSGGSAGAEPPAAARSPLMHPVPGRMEAPAASWSRRHADWVRDRERRAVAGAVPDPDHEPEPARWPEPVRWPAPAPQPLPQSPPGSSPQATGQRGDESGGGHESGGDDADVTVGDVGTADTAGTDVATAGDVTDVSDGDHAGHGGRDEEPGDHGAGVSVADLLAAYGLADRPRRRRRD